MTDVVRAGQVSASAAIAVLSLETSLEQRTPTDTTAVEVSTLADADATARQTRRAALLIGVGKYRQRELANLRAASADVRELARVLRDPAVGAFDNVSCLVDRSAHEIRVALERFFANRDRDDLLVLHYSGHGLRDATGELYLTGCDTDQALPDATGISAAFLNRRMTLSRSRRILVLVDACHSGVLTSGLVPRGAAPAQEVNRALHGAGRVIIAATGPLDQAFEPQGMGWSERRRSHLSVFTGAVVAGLDSGDADLDGDGRISSDDLYQYVHDKVQRTTPQQIPALSTTDVTGKLLIAWRRGYVETPAQPGAETGEALTGAGRMAPEPLLLKPGLTYTWSPLATMASCTLLWVPWLTIGESPAGQAAAIIESAITLSLTWTAAHITDALFHRACVNEHGIRLGLPLFRNLITWDQIADIIVIRTLFSRRIKLVGVPGGRTYVLPWPRSRSFARPGKLQRQATAIASRRPSRPPPIGRSARRNAQLWLSVCRLVIPVVLVLAVAPWSRPAWPWSGEAISLPSPCAVLTTTQREILAGPGTRSVPAWSTSTADRPDETATCTWTKPANESAVATAKGASAVTILVVSLDRYVDGVGEPFARALAASAFTHGCGTSAEAIAGIGEHACANISIEHATLPNVRSSGWSVTVRAYQGNVVAEVIWNDAEQPDAAALRNIEDATRQALGNTRF